jgi:serine/threonine protein kinase
VRGPAIVACFFARQAGRGVSIILLASVIMSSATPIPHRIGRHEVVRLLGRGAMASVYEGRDPSLERRVAIKVLDQRELGHPDLAERFLREARAVARLSHPHIVGVYDVGVEGDLAYMVMELMRGQTLQQRLAPGRPWPLGALLPVARQLLDALAYVHAKGVVHRDIKPANVMLDDAGRVKLADFGVARVEGAADRTQAGTIIGTPRYMAPEQLSGGVVDARTDLFAVGALLYRLATGRDAFDGGSVYQVMHAVMQGDPAAPSSLPGVDLPPALDAVLLKALAREPSARHESAAAFARALADALADVGPELPPPEALPEVPVPPPSAGAAEGFSPGTPVDATCLRPPDGPVGASPAPGPDPLGGLFGSAPMHVEPVADGTMYLSPPSTAGRPPPGLGVQLVVTASADAGFVGRVHALQGDELLLGRGADCALQLHDPACSRHHATIRRQGAGWVIEDLASTNGSWLDGRPLAKGRPVPLMPGASIRLGDTTLGFNHSADTTLPDLVDQVLADRYRIESVLRASPKATVYVARVGKAGPRVALKILSPALADYPGYKERLAQAAEAASRLQHPHVCQLLDHGVLQIPWQGRVLEAPYVSHALLGGGSLGERMASHDPAPTPEITRWLTQIGHALSHAHRRGVVHGDLKPTSIGFDDEGNAYLMDFALALATSEADQPAPLFGAPAYMAPEVWDGQPPAPASDQFALAALAYALYTGTRPFGGHEDPKLRARNFRRGAPPVHEEARHAGREDLPRALSPVLARALAVEAGSRYASVDEFVAALERALRPGAASGSTPFVFVSYQHEASAGWAVLLARELKERHKIGAFVDTQRLDAAVQFPDKLARAIERCDVFVCLLAAGTLDSRWVRDEIRIAHGYGKPMLPVFQESFAAVEPEGMDESVRALLQFDGVHLLDRRNIHVDHTIDDLARLVMGTLRQAGGPGATSSPAAAGPPSAVDP